jgi:hypothetical protein
MAGRTTEATYSGPGHAALGLSLVEAAAPEECCPGNKA